jgi:glutaredoxin 3
MRPPGSSVSRRPATSWPIHNPVDRPVELYTTAGCPHSAAAREDLEWRGIEFVEYDVERDPEARARMLTQTEGQRTVPVIVEEGKPVQVGWMGRGCAF